MSENMRKIMDAVDEQPARTDMEDVLRKAQEIDGSEPMSVVKYMSTAPREEAAQFAAEALQAAGAEIAKRGASEKQLDSLIDMLTALKTNL